VEDITVLRQALPYIQRFKGKTFVVKFGGEAIDDAQVLERLIEDVALLHLVGIRVVLVHGGGKQMTETASALGIETKFVGGRRVTDNQTLDVVKMVLAGKLSVELLSALKRRGVRAMSVSGVAAGVIEAKKRPPRKVSGGGDEPIDFGHVGDIIRIDTELIDMLLAKDYLPVLSPLGADDEGNVFNINADVVATRLAAELRAEKLLLMTGTPGVMEDIDDPTTVISRLTAADARKAIDDEVIKGGMIPKLEESMKAIEAGCGSVHVLSALEPHQLLLEIFTKSGCGTMLVP
jgi:acetylglutamate kinase